MNNLNPDIKKMLIGSREMVEITIYPLSISEESELINIIISAIMKFSSEQTEEINDKEAINIMTEVIKENLEKIYLLVTDNKTPYSTMSNNQLVQFGEIIFEVNFESLLKNGRSLFNKIQGLLLLKGQSPQSVNDMDTNSMKSSINDLEMVALQEDK